MTAVMAKTTHLFLNSLLLSAWNPVRCVFWNTTCSDDSNNNNNNNNNEDVAWILNWFAYSKLHLAIILGCLATSSLGSPLMESKVGFLSSCILLCYLVEGTMSLQYFNVPMAIYQAIILVALFVIILFWISKEELRPGYAYLAAAHNNHSFSQLSRHRHRILIPSVTLGMQTIFAILRVVGTTFGNSFHGSYLGNDSSDLYQNISNLIACDALLIAAVMLFALIFGSMDQHRWMLHGHAIMLFLSLLMLSSRQAEMMPADQVKSAKISTFSSIVLTMVGSL